MFIVLFFLIWICGIVAWCFSVSESIGVWRFEPYAYRLGPKIKNRSVTAHLKPMLPGQEIYLPNVKAKAHSFEEIFFRSSFKLFQFRTPFPIKGILVLSNSDVKITGRFPLGPVLFFSAWLGGCTIAGINMLYTHGVSRLWCVLFGWGFLGILMAISIPFELKRHRAAANALLAHLS